MKTEDDDVAAQRWTTVNTSTLGTSFFANSTFTENPS